MHFLKRQDFHSEPITGLLPELSDSPSPEDNGVPVWQRSQEFNPTVHGRHSERLKMYISRESWDTFISTGASTWNQYNLYQDLSFKLSRLKSRSASSMGASPWRYSSCFVKVWSNWLLVCPTCSAVFKLGSIKGPIFEAKSSSNSAWDLSNLCDEKELHFGFPCLLLPFCNVIHMHIIRTSGS